MNSVTEYLDRVDPEWMADHRAGNRRVGRAFFVVGLIATAPIAFLTWTFTDMALSESAWWCIAAVIAAVCGLAWLYLFVIRQTVYTMRTGNFR